MNILGFSLFFLLFSLFMPLNHPLNDFADMAYFRWTYTGAYGTAMFLLCVLCLSFLRGALWSGVAACVSMFTRSRAAVFFTPFAGTFLLAQLFSAVGLSPNIRVDMWLTGRTAFNNSEIQSMLAAGLFSALALTVVGIIFIDKGKELVEGEAR